MDKGLAWPTWEKSTVATFETCEIYRQSLTKTRFRCAEGDELIDVNWLSNYSQDQSSTYISDITVYLYLSHSLALQQWIGFALFWRRLVWNVDGPP